MCGRAKWYGRLAIMQPAPSGPERADRDDRHPVLTTVAVAGRDDDAQQRRASTPCCVDPSGGEIAGFPGGRMQRIQRGDCNALGHWRESILSAAMYAYYDTEADIAWLPTGHAERVVSEEVEWGLVDHDAATDDVVAVEIWNASKRLPMAILEALPAPSHPHGAAA